MAFKFTPIKEIKIREEGTLKSALYDLSLPDEEHYLPAYVPTYPHKENEVSSVTNMANDEEAKQLADVNEKPAEQTISSTIKRITDTIDTPKQVNIHTSNRNFYTVKDILFGLRKELIKCNNELQVLEQYITYNNKKVTDVEFLISDHNQLFCKLNLKRNHLSKLIEYFCGAPYNGVICKEGCLGIYDFAPNDYDLKLADDYVSEFTRKVRTIMDLPISKVLTDYTAGLRVTVTKNEDNRSMFFHETSNCLLFHRNDTRVNYDPNQDIVTHTVYQNRLGRTLESMLTLEIPKDIFSITEQEIIESSGVLNKGIRIISDNQDRVTNLQVFEDDKEYVLRKVKR